MTPAAAAPQLLALPAPEPSAAAGVAPPLPLALVPPQPLQRDLQPVEERLERLRADREAHSHRQLWTKDSHGGPYRKVRAWWGGDQAQGGAVQVSGGARERERVRRRAGCGGLMYGGGGGVCGMVIAAVVC